MLDATELPPGGPAWLLGQPGFMQSDWDGEPKLVPSGRRPPSGFDPPAVCRRWQELTGDAGWGGVLAETAAGPSPRSACIFFRPGQDPLPLVNEALALLPHQQRWNVTFSTWFTKLPPGIDCQWRFLLADSPEAKLARRQQHALQIDLTAPLPNAGSSPTVQAARTGIVTAAAQPIAPRTAAVPSTVPGQEYAPGTQMAPPPVGSAEYGLGPPLVASSAQTGLPSVRRKRTSILRTVAAVGTIAALLLFTATGAVLGLLARREHKQPKSSENALAAARGGANSEQKVRPSDKQETKETPSSQEENASTATRSDADERPKKNVPYADQRTTDKHEENRNPESQPQPYRTEQENLAKKEAEPSKNVTEAQSDSQAKSEPAPPKPGWLDLPLPNDARTSSRSAAVELTKTGPIDPARCNLGLIGSENFFDDKVDIQRSDDRGVIRWQIGRKAENAIGPARRLGQFTIQGETLFFEWQSSDSQLRNCLLTLSPSGDSETVYRLRKPVTLRAATISFKKSKNTVKIELPDRADTIKRNLLRLRVAVEGVPGASVSPDGPANADTGVVVTIPFRPDPTDPTKRDVQVAIRLEESGGSLQLTESNTGIESYWRGRTLETRRHPLSFRIVDDWTKSQTDEQKLLEKRREAAQEALDKLGDAPKDPTQDPHQADRKELRDRLNGIGEDVVTCARELDRCEKLKKVLDSLHGTISFTVFYPIGDHEVVLAETSGD